MTEKPSTLQITLTPEQQQQLQQRTGASSSTVRLSLTELERRLAPGVRVGN